MAVDNDTLSLPTLLIDGDLIAYRAACACEQEVEWSEEVWTLSCDLQEVKKAIVDSINSLQKTLKGGTVLVCFSCRKGNWRKNLNPAYKANRAGKRKPMGWSALLDWTRDPAEFPFKVVERPLLEADDCMGIMATRPGSNCIIVSDDKDFLCIPGKFYRIGRGDREGEMFTSSKEEADKFFLLQTLMGDPTDGYKGCTGVGERKANAILDKGAHWGSVLEAYTKAGQTPEDALLNARMARILRWEDYNRETQEPILWTPK